jgi:hypothetical protein
VTSKKYDKLPINVFVCYFLLISELSPKKTKKSQQHEESKNRQQLYYLEVRYSDNLDDCNYQRNTLKVQSLKSVHVATNMGDIEYYR